jgi:hypothetical protein
MTPSPSWQRVKQAGLEAGAPTGPVLFRRDGPIASYLEFGF